MIFRNGVGKELRAYFGSLFVFLFIIGVIIALIQYPVLDTNKEVVMVLIGTIGASIPVLISSISGTSATEMSQLKSSLDKKEKQIELLNKSKDEYEKLIINLQDKMLKGQIDLIDQFVLKAAMDFDDKKQNNRTKKCTCGKEECLCKGV